MSKNKNALDAFLSYISPSTGFKRAQARAALDVVSKGRAYEGASKGRRTAGWKTFGTDANAETNLSLSVLRNRSRDLVRNNGYAAKAVQVIVENTIGTGIVAKIGGSAKGRVKSVADVWKRWAESTDCDFDGLHDFYGLQSLAFRSMVEGGDVLIRRVRTGYDQQEIPLQIQILEGDFLDVNKSTIGPKQNTRIIQGVEFDESGKRVAYWLFDKHPGDQTAYRNLQSKRYLAEDIIHLYRVDRAGQWRGVPWAAGAIMTLRDFDEYEDAQLIRQKIAACFAAFVYDQEPPAETGDGSLNVDKLEPGIIESLPNGKDIKFASPPGVEGYSDYSRVTLRKVACAFGVTYEALTNDYSNVNFSSGRMGWLEFQRSLEAWRWRIVIPRFCNPIWGWFSDAAALKGINLSGVDPTWTPPRREMIDPSKEIAAQALAIRNGLKSLPATLREGGDDPEEVMNEIAESNKALDKLGLVLDSDPRNVSKGGMTQQDKVVEAQSAASTSSNNEGNA